MLIGQHIVASGLTSAVFAGLTKSWEGTTACFLAGILIDLDHLVDYMLIKKRMCWSIKKLEDFCMKEENEKIYLFLHSFELMAVLWIVLFYFKLDIVWVGVIFGMSTHLFIDQVANPIYPLAYFLLYRIRLGFPKSIFLNFSRGFAKNTNVHNEQ